MARLNEPPVSLDSIETLRRKMLRQNRDLAKSNNVRALRIRELENECACMLSENLELRGRILELEKQVEDSDARRIADHALAIKAKLESQLTEWGTLVAGLGLEPSIKRHSPRIRKPARPRLSFSAARPSPSKRRLRDVARDVEDLGHISETKSCPRRSMNPEQILALRSEPDSADSPDLGPPPMSKFIDDDPVKMDSPTAHPPQAPCPKSSIEPPVSFASPKIYLPHVESAEPNPAAGSPPPSPSPKIPKPPPATQSHDLQPATLDEPVTVRQPIKTGSKRKFGARENLDHAPVRPATDENHPSQSVTGKPSIRDRANGKTLKDMAAIRKDGRDRNGADPSARKPLAAKSTNDDIRSPRKTGSTDDLHKSKTNMTKTKSYGSRTKVKAKVDPSIMVQPSNDPEVPLPSTTDPEEPLSEPALHLQSSPEPVPSDSSHRGDTPPPTDISSRGETARPGRRNRVAISYAEPNLRDKMRRPSKQLYDAVTGEGKYSRRSSSQAETPAPEPQQVKRESLVAEPWQNLPDAGKVDGATPSSAAGKASYPPQTLPDSVVTDRRRRPSSVSSRATDPTNRGTERQEALANTSADTSASGDVDIYEFTSSSPQPDTEEAAETKRPSRRQTVSSRRLSTAMDGDGGGTIKERNSARRRSMLV